jgi:hypothetical protein
MPNVQDAWYQRFEQSPSPRQVGVIRRAADRLGEREVATLIWYLPESHRPAGVMATVIGIDRLVEEGLLEVRLVERTQ